MRSGGGTFYIITVLICGVPDGNIRVLLQQIINDGVTAICERDMERCVPRLVLDVDVTPKAENGLHDGLVALEACVMDGAVLERIRCQERAQSAHILEQVHGHVFRS